MPPERVRNQRNCKAIQCRTVFLALFCYTRERKEGTKSAPSCLSFGETAGYTGALTESSRADRYPLCAAESALVPG
jgi:hypothetical protein